MSNRSTKFVASALAIALGLAGVAAIGFPEVAIAQQQTSELDRAIAEGKRLYKEGSEESLRKAIRQFEKALELALSAQEKDKQALSLDFLGTLHSALGERRKALEFYNQSLQIDRAMSDRSGEAVTLNNIGIVYSALGEKQKALDHYNQALPLFRAVGYRAKEATTLNNIGNVYSDLGEKQKALGLYNQSLVIYRAVGDRSGEAGSLNNIGLVYDDLGEKQKALEYYNQALPILRAGGNRLGEATTLNNIGLVYDTLGEKQKALEYYNQALPILRVVGDQSVEARTLTNIGAVYVDLGEKQKALEYYDQALPISRVVGDRSVEATILNNIGLVYDTLSEKQKALDYYNQALPVLRAVGSRSGEAMTLNNIGLVYDTLNEKQKALDYYNQALPILRAVRNRSGESTTLNNIGRVYNALGEKQKALDFYNQSLLLSRAVGDRSSEARILDNIAGVYYTLGEKKKALDFYRQSLSLSRAVGDRSVEANTLDNIGYLLNKQQPDVSIVFYKQSVNLYESLRKDIRKLPRDTQETYVKSVSDTYRRLADALLAQGRIGEAQKVMELLKIQELNTLTADTRSAPSPAQIKLNSLEQEIANKYTSLVDFGQQLSECETKRCSRLSEYNTQYKELTKAYTQFIAEIKQKLSEARLTEVDESTEKFIAQADRIVSAQPNSILIYPLVLPDKIRILWATKGGALDQAECSLSEAQLSKLVEDFRTALQTSDDLNPVQKTGQQLHNCLLPPKLRTVLKTNKIENLIFVPDRVTNYIPMAALHDGNNYLIETYSVANILAASYTDTQDKLPKTPTILGFGLSQSVTLINPTRNFSSLPFVPTELDAIIQPQNNPQKGIFPGQQWLDRDFTLDRLTTGLLDKPNILHIATHGEFVATDPKASYLVLGDSTPYALSQVEYLRNLSNIHLVVLSACETALGGRDRNGLEVAGISAYFLGDPSRAKAVLASLWKVNDPATSILMSEFYKTLHQNNLSKSQSLRKVQREMIASKLTLQDAANRAGVRLYEPNKKRPQNLSHPYYWAPFILIGNSQ